MLYLYVQLFAGSEWLVMIANASKFYHAHPSGECCNSHSLKKYIYSFKAKHGLVHWSLGQLPAGPRRRPSAPLVVPSSACSRIPTCRGKGWMWWDASKEKIESTICPQVWYMVQPILNFGR